MRHDTNNLLKRFKLALLFLMIGGVSFVQAQSLPATITLNAATTVSSFIPRNIFGVNTQYWVNNGYNGTDSKGVAVKTKLQRAGSYFLRYPGGSSSDQFHWNGTGTWGPAGDGSSSVTSGYWIPSSTAYSSGFECNETRLGSTSPNTRVIHSLIDDNNAATTWMSNVDTDYPKHQWVYLQLSNAGVPFNAVTIVWGNPYATSFQVQYWNGGGGAPVQTSSEANWVTTSIGTVTGTGGTQGVTFNTTPASRYVRILMTASSASVTANLGPTTVIGPAYAIAELTVYNGATTVSNNTSAIVNGVASQSQATASSMDPASSIPAAGGGSTSFGFVAYMNYINSMSPAGVPLITVNFGTGTPQEAAAWVHYANAVQGYNIHYWEIGNEMDGQWEAGGPINANDYARRYIEFYNAMQAEASADGVPITVMGPVCSNPTANSNTSTSGSDFIPVFLSRLASDPGGNQLSDVQGIVFHWYPGDTGTFTTPAQIAGYYTTLTGWLNAAGHPQASTIPLFMDEYNINAGTPHITVQLASGLWLSNWLGEFIKNFGSRGSANLWTTINGGNDAVTITGGDLGYLDNSSYQEHATYWAMQMMAADWAIAGDTQTHELVSAASSTSNLLSYADARPDGLLSLLVVNESTVDTFDTQFKVNNFIPASAATGWSFNSSNYVFQTTTTPYNANPDTAPTTVTYSNVSASFPVTFGPSSINVIQLVSVGTVATATPTLTPAPCSVGGFTCTPTFTATQSPTPTITVTPTLTLTPTITLSPTVTLSPTITLTPTITQTPNPNFAVPFPNPNDGQEPLSFFYNVTGPATEVDLKIFTVANRLIFADSGLATGAGQHPYSLDWAQQGLNLANGLYYFVLDVKNNSQRTRQIMKVLIRR